MEKDSWGNNPDILSSQSGDFWFLANGQEEAFDEEYWNYSDSIYDSVEIKLSIEVSLC